MRRFGRREGTETRMKSKLRHGLMSVVIFDHQEVCCKAKSFVTSIASAAISLANWSTKEENAAIQDTCSKMYELSMLVSTVVDLFSREYSAMGNSLKELLRQEMSLDILNKKVCQAKAKAVKLKKQNIEKEKELANLGNAELEYEELKASFDAQNTKHEILKAQCLRESITRLADGTATFAERVSTISEAEKEIANSIPVVPTQIGRNKEYQGEEAADKVVKRTADALNIRRPVSFKELLAQKQAHARKLRVKSCFLPETIEPASPEELEWVEVEQSMSASLLDLASNSECGNQERLLSSQMFSYVKDRLAVDNANGRSYISHPGIEQRLAFKARGLAEDERPDPPDSTPPRSPARQIAPRIDLRVEPYAVGRWTPDERGLYARANLLSSGLIRQSRSWEGNENNLSEIDEESGEYTTPRQFPNSGECLKPRQFTNQKEVVYAVLEQEGTDVSTDQKYVDVIQ